MARFGDLRHSVTIKRDTSTRGVSQGLKPWTTSADVATVFGSLATKGQSRESFGSPDRAVSVGEFSWTIHNRADVTPKMRIYFGSRVFEILSVPTVPGEIFLSLPCKEIV